jgi:hypothetical protein
MRPVQAGISSLCQEAVFPFAIGSERSCKAGPPLARPADLQIVLYITRKTEYKNVLVMSNDRRNLSLKQTVNRGIPEADLKAFYAERVVSKITFLESVKSPRFSFNQTASIPPESVGRKPRCDETLGIP